MKRELMTSTEFTAIVSDHDIKLPTSIEILGSVYEIRYESEDNDDDMKDLEGCCDNPMKLIKINQCLWDEDQPIRSSRNLFYVLRHEIVHAFFFECGLGDECDYAMNEELIDWIALKSPQIFRAMNKAGILKDGYENVA